jgi:hypothetical protein
MQDIRRARFREEKEQEDPAEAGQPHELPDRPGPAFSLNSEAANERAKDGTANSTDSPDC